MEEIFCSIHLPLDLASCPHMYVFHRSIPVQSPVQLEIAPVTVNQSKDGLMINVHVAISVERQKLSCTGRVRSGIINSQDYNSTTIIAIWITSLLSFEPT